MRQVDLALNLTIIKTLSMSKQGLIDEARRAFNLLYVPVAIKNNRINREDFIKVAIEIMKEANRNRVSDEDKEIIAKTLLSEFNSKLNPKLDENTNEVLINILTGKSTISLY